MVSPSVATMSGARVEYTERDDNLLAQYLAKYSPTPDGRTGHAIYKRLAENADNLWPFSKRHPWQSWRERYKKHKDEFDTKIRRLQKRAMSADSNMDVTTSEQELSAHQTKGENAIKRRSSARKLPSEEHSFLGLSEAEPSSIRKPSETKLSEDAREKTVNDAQGSTELTTNRKRRGDGFEESTGREGKRRKRSGREVVFEDELENGKRTTPTQNAQFATVVNYLLDRFGPEELNHVQDLIRKRTESPALSAEASPAVHESTPAGRREAERIVDAAIRQTGWEGRGAVDEDERAKRARDASRNGVAIMEPDQGYQREYPNLSDFEDTNDVVNTVSTTRPALPGSFISQDDTATPEEGPLFLKAASEVPESNDDDVEMEQDEVEDDDGSVRGEGLVRENHVDIGAGTDEEVDELDEEDDEVANQVERSSQRSPPPDFSDDVEPTPKRDADGSADRRATASKRVPGVNKDEDEDDYFASPATSEKSTEDARRAKPQTTNTTNGTSTIGLASRTKSTSKNTNADNRSARILSQVTQNHRDQNVQQLPLQTKERKSPQTNVTTRRRPLSKHPNMKRRLPSPGDSDTDAELDDEWREHEAAKQAHAGINGSADTDWPVRRRSVGVNGVSGVNDQKSDRKMNASLPSVLSKGTRVPKTPAVFDRVHDSRVDNLGRREGSIRNNEAQTNTPRAMKTSPHIDAVHETKPGSAAVSVSDSPTAPVADTDPVDSTPTTALATTNGKCAPSPLAGPSKLRTEVRDTDIGMLTERSDFSRRAHGRMLNDLDDDGENEMDVEISQPQFRVPPGSNGAAVPSRVPGSSHSASTDVFYAPATRWSTIGDKGKQRDHSGFTESSRTGGIARASANKLARVRAIRRQTFGGFRRNDGLPAPNVDLRLRQELLRKSGSFDNRRRSLVHRHANETPKGGGMGLAELFRTPQEREREALSRRTSISSIIDLNSTFYLPEDEVSETDRAYIHRGGLNMFIKRFSENHGFREEVVWNVYNMRRDLVETDIILRGMREEAESFVEKLLDGDEDRNEQEGEGKGRPKDEDDERADAKPDLELKALTVSGSVSQRENRKRFSAPSPPTPARNHLDFTPVRDEALLRRVRREHEEFSPPSMTRAGTFTRLAGEGRLDEALARERRRTSHGGTLRPFKAMEKDNGLQTPGALTSTGRNQKRMEAQETNVDTDAVDPFRDSKREHEELPMREHAIPQAKKAQTMHLGENAPEETEGDKSVDIWTEEDDQIILQDGDLEQLEYRKGKGSVKARIAQLMASGKFL